MYAPPPPAVAQCLYSLAGMSCSDSASWVQAIGTIFAVVASAVVAFALHLSESKRHRLAEEARVREQREAHEALVRKAATLCLMVAAAPVVRHSDRFSVIRMRSTHR